MFPDPGPPEIRLTTKRGKNHLQVAVKWGKFHLWRTKQNQKCTMLRLEMIRHPRKRLDIGSAGRR